MSLEQQGSTFLCIWSCMRLNILWRDFSLRYNQIQQVFRATLTSAIEKPGAEWKTVSQAHPAKAVSSSYLHTKSYTEHQAQIHTTTRLGAVRKEKILNPITYRPSVVIWRAPPLRLHRQHSCRNKTPSELDQKPLLDCLSIPENDTKANCTHPPPISVPRGWTLTAAHALAEHREQDQLSFTKSGRIP